MDDLYVSTHIFIIKHKTKAYYRFKYHIKKIDRLEPKSCLSIHILKDIRQYSNNHKNKIQMNQFHIFVVVLFYQKKNVEKMAQKENFYTFRILYDFPFHFSTYMF